MSTSRSTATVLYEIVSTSEEYNGVERVISSIYMQSHFRRDDHGCYYSTKWSRPYPLSTRQVFVKKLHTFALI